jgi:hypothetical protein
MNDDERARERAEVRQAIVAAAVIGERIRCVRAVEKAILSAMEAQPRERALDLALLGIQINKAIGGEQT